MMAATITNSAIENALAILGVRCRDPQRGLSRLGTLCALTNMLPNKVRIPQRSKPRWVGPIPTLAVLLYRLHTAVTLSGITVMGLTREGIVDATVRKASGPPLPYG